MKITIKDIARLAAVSPSTVSRALQGSPRISREVRERIQQIANEQGFRPNQMARSLVMQASHIVGVLFPGSASASMGHPFYPALLSGASQVAGAKGYHLLLGTGGEGLPDEDSARSLVDSGYVSGLLLLSAYRGPLSQLLPTSRVPVVEIGSPPEQDRRFYVDNDNEAAGAYVTDYLLDRGHRRIALLGDTPGFSVTENRRQGWALALQRRNIPAREDWVVSSRFLDNAANEERLRAMFQQRDRPTAVVCMDDPLALKLVALLSSLSLQVPKDVSVISFNNTAAGEYTLPPLSSVDVNPRLLGEEAMGLLLQVIAGQWPQPRHIQVPFQLVERGSVAWVET